MEQLDFPKPQVSGQKGPTRSVPAAILSILALALQQYCTAISKIILTATTSIFDTFRLVK